ncbi:protein FAM177A1-like [Xenia sp. Carnegie-2017]|uniref:protein FAM177A1-like n=1 Tax=Xenia sp. Carnegie-2017 TaxID=2897299 RepID=UPI001F047D99|nr:protein FAM177A1-like [Xenia sp. Carnegie-2017]
MSIMADVVDADELKTVHVVTEFKESTHTNVDSTQQNASCKESIQQNVLGSKEEISKRVQMDSLNSEDIDEDMSSSEYTFDDGDDEADKDGVLNDSMKKKRKRFKKKKTKHFDVESNSSSDNEENGAFDDTNINPSDLTWLLWMWYYVRAVSSGALKAAEFLGEKLAAFFGITTPKYQYVIDEYYRLKDLEKEEEEKERKEQEFVAQRKLEELSKMEGGKEKLVYNQVSSSLSNAQSAGTIP